MTRRMLPCFCDESVPTGMQLSLIDTGQPPGQPFHVSGTAGASPDLILPGGEATPNYDQFRSLGRPSQKQIHICETARNPFLWGSFHAFSLVLLWQVLLNKFHLALLCFVRPDCVGVRNRTSAENDRKM